MTFVPQTPGSQGTTRTTRPGMRIASRLFPYRSGLYSGSASPTCSAPEMIATGMTHTGFFQLICFPRERKRSPAPGSRSTIGIRHKPPLISSFRMNVARSNRSGNASDLRRSISRRVASRSLPPCVKRCEHRRQEKVRCATVAVARPAPAAVPIVCRPIPNLHVMRQSPDRAPRNLAELRLRRITDQPIRVDPQRRLKAFGILCLIGLANPHYR